MSSPSLEGQPTKAKAGSRKAPIPVDAPTGFLSAMNLVTKDQLHQDYATPSREPSKSPSLQGFAYRDPSEDAKAVATGNLRKPTKKPTLATEGSADATEETTAPAPKKPRKKAAAKIDDNVMGPAETAPKRGRPRKAVASTTESADGQVPAPVKRVRKKTTVDQEDISTDAAAPAPKRSRKKAAKADVVDDAAETVAKPKKPPPKPRAPRKTKAVLQAEAAEREAQSAFQSWQPPTEPGIPSETTAVSVDKTTVTTVPAVDKAKKPTKPRTTRKTKASVEADAATAEHAPELAFKPWEAPLYAAIETVKPIETIDLDHAPRRRMDWTPPPASLAPDHRPNVHENNDKDARSPVSVDMGITGNTSGVDASEPLAVTDNATVAEESPKPLSFADLMGNFAYQQGEAGPSLQRTDGEPATKRRRIEPISAKPKPEKVSKKKEPKKKAEPKPKKPKEPKPPKEPKEKAEPKPKKPRAPPKKPLTITALATAAYRPQVVQPESADAAKLTSYFQPESGQDEQAGETSAQASLAPTKRKSAKPPAKLNKKAQAALVAAQYKLESPETAHRNMRNQDWLFGTSSQLAAAESPSEYRDLQRAIKESEEFVGSQDMEGSQALEAFRPVSRMRVPSAPHGTDLSIGQAHRDLWLSAARDLEENTFASDEGLGIIMEEDEAAFPPMAVPGLPKLSLKRPFVQADETQDSGYVDIDDISSIASDKQKGLTVMDRTDQKAASDGSGQPIRTADAQPIPTTEAEVIVERAILKRLDPNASMSKSHMDIDSKPSSPIKLLISRYAAEPISLLSSPAKAPRGRPRKAAIDLSSPPKPRNRPSKSLQPFSGPTPPGPERSFLAEHAATQPQPHNVESSPYLDIDDIVGKTPLKQKRPLPNTQPTKQSVLGSSPYLDIDDFAFSSPERPLLHRHTASQPAPHSSPYLDIDDISDAEAASAPPSPPKLNKGKAPAVQNTLELSNPAAVPPVKPRSDKQLQADFATISPILFPKITAVVKGAPRTKDLKHPSWWEKMLLYDPIVLEDFTAWLNVQGVRIESERERVVVKAKKGRKRKGEAGEQAVEEQAVVEKEIIREELRCWMVQKWCEENSVCCLWKDGMRGGVKQKY